MPTAFDPLKAAQEVLAAMRETRAVLVQMERELVDQHASTEQRLNHVRKVLGALEDYVIAPQRDKVERLLREQK